MANPDKNKLYFDNGYKLDVRFKPNYIAMMSASTLSSVAITRVTSSATNGIRYILTQTSTPYFKVENIDNLSQNS